MLIATNKYSCFWGVLKAGVDAWDGIEGQEGEQNQVTSHTKQAANAIISEQQ